MNSNVTRRLQPTPDRYSLEKSFGRLLLAVLLFQLVSGLRAQSAGTEETKVSDDDMQIDGVFNSALPGTVKKHRVKLLFRPHFGDFHRKDYLRVPLSLRYGITGQWEVTGGVEGYFSHGFGDKNWFEKNGFSSLNLSTKYRIGQRLWAHWDTGVGFDYRTPVSSPPSDVSDGLRHLSYYASFSRELESLPDWRVFWNVGADDVSTTGRPVVLEKNDLGDDSVNVTGGVVWQRAHHSYTFEASYATTRLTGIRNRDVFSIRPGIIWKLPKKYTFNAKGDWFLGVSTRVSHGTDGSDFGLSGKLRVSFNFKQWWRSKFQKETN